MELSDNLAELARRIELGAAQPAKRFVIFAGAALSMARPSYLPLAAPLVRATLGALLRGEMVERALREADLSASETIEKIAAKSLLPEALYQVMADIAGLQRVVGALRAMDGSAPNANHRLIAALAAQGAAGLLATTNFDDLVEKALSERGVAFETRSGADATVDWLRAAFDPAPPEGRTFRIWKIHGDIADIDHPERHRKIVTTINQIGSVASEPVARGLDAALDGRAALFLGYSANDRDIAGKLASIRLERLFLNALERDPETAVHRLMAAHGDAARWLVGDINEVLGALARELGQFDAVAAGDPDAFKPVSDDEWREKIVGGVEAKIRAWDEDPAQAIEPIRKLLATATILRDVGEPAAGAALGQAARGLAEGRLHAEVVFELACALRQLGDADEAAARLEEASAAFEKEGLRLEQTFPLIELAGLAAFRGDPEKAERLAMRALEISAEGGPATIRANACLLLAELLKTRGDIAAAIEHATEARALYKNDASLAGEARALSFLGSVCELRGEWAEALRLYRDALELERLTGNALGEATALNRIGEVFRQTGEHAQALEHFDGAGALYESAGNRDGVAAVLSNAGIVLTELREYEQAQEVLARSIGLHREIQDIEGEAKAWNNLGNVFIHQRRWAECERAYETARAMFETLGDVRGLAMAESNLGSVALHARGDVDGAVARYRTALEIHRRLGEQRAVEMLEAEIARLLQPRVLPATGAQETDHGAREPSWGRRLLSRLLGKG